MAPPSPPALQKIPVSVVVITKNEGGHLAKTLKALEGFQEVVIVDSGSVDSTRAVAEQCGARVCERSFDDFASQKNFGVQQARGPWILSLDADEIPDSQLIESIGNQVKEGSPATLAAYALHRRNIHFGRELRWGGQGGDFPVRLFLKGQAEFVNPVHEVLKVKGRTGRLKGTLWHESNRSVSEYMEKLSHYTTLEAKLAREKGRKVSLIRCGVIPLGTFVYRYVIRLGFLDGFEGFLFHSLSAFYGIIRQARQEEVIK